MGPRFLYLHGFASSVRSRKATSLAAHFAARGATLELLDARVPSLEHLRLSEIMRVTAAALGPSDRAVVVGSSLGGLAAARLAEDDPRVAALVLLAPAFRLAERWKARIGTAVVDNWRTSGFLTVTDYATGGDARVDWGFIEDAETVDARNGGWPDVRVATLIVHGRHDETVDIEASRQFAEDKRHVRLVEVEDGHELSASLDRIASETDAFLVPYLGT